MFHDLREACGLKKSLYLQGSPQELQEAYAKDFMVVCDQNRTLELAFSSHLNRLVSLGMQVLSLTPDSRASPPQDSEYCRRIRFGIGFMADMDPPFDLG